MLQKNYVYVLEIFKLYKVNAGHFNYRFFLIDFLMTRSLVSPVATNRNVAALQRHHRPKKQTKKNHLIGNFLKYEQSSAIQFL